MLKVLHDILFLTWLTNFASIILYFSLVVYFCVLIYTGFTLCMEHIFKFRTVKKFTESGLTVNFCYIFGRFKSIKFINAQMVRQGSHRQIKFQMGIPSLRYLILMVLERQTNGTLK